MHSARKSTEKDPRLWKPGVARISLTRSKMSENIWRSETCSSRSRLNSDHLHSRSNSELQNDPRFPTQGSEATRQSSSKREGVASRHNSTTSMSPAWQTLIIRPRISHKLRAGLNPVHQHKPMLSRWCDYKATDRLKYYIYFSVTIKILNWILFYRL